MKYALFENDKPANAISQGLSKGIGWDNNEFDTFEQASEYANKWLGPQFGGSDDGSAGIVFLVNEKYYFSPGCFIEIKEVA